MCGIAGIIDFKEKVPGERLQPMLQAIAHRGPDDEGQLMGDFFAAGMRRLSIIDLATGNQPIYNERKTVFTFFNGEIYNFIELRKELERKGHQFYTHSDTEVLVHYYEEEGIDFVKRLNGMFSFLLGDLTTNTFYIVRDHYGIKPLYYNVRDERVLFASELKSILASGLVEACVQEESLVNYLNYLYVPSPKSIFKDIRKLEAGHYLEISAKGMTNSCWYDIKSFTTPSSKNHCAIRDEVRFLLEDAIRLQMRSDVPVGAYLSGGIDSSLIAALASKNTSLPLATFSVGFENSEFDELPYARQVAKLYKTQHHELIVSPDDALNYLPLLMKYMDEPIGDSAVLPSYLVSKLAAEHVKVALSGLGGDELFGGYSRYNPSRGRFQFLQSLPEPLLKYGFLPMMKAIQPAWGKQLERMMNPLPDDELYHERVRQMSTEMIDQLTGSSAAANFVGKDLKKVFNTYPQKDEVNQRMYTDIQLYMNDQLLHLTDRMSMAVSLEARVPLLDHRLVELSLTIPSALKISTADTKIILKEAVRDLLPDSILNRPKWGFAAPHKTWALQKGFQRLLEQTISGNLVSDGILNRRGVENFLGNKGLIQQYSTWVWPLISLEVWYTQAKDFTN
jgi:asparagine synthase (glutamine-hydrolysing)